MAVRARNNDSALHVILTRNLLTQSGLGGRPLLLSCVSVNVTLMTQMYILGCKPFICFLMCTVFTLLCIAFMNSESKRFKMFMSHLLEGAGQGCDNPVCAERYTSLPSDMQENKVQNIILLYGNTAVLL